MYYEEVFRELNRQRVKYLVVGGIALVLHGVVRLTADLDLMLEMSSANLTRFLAVMKTLNYKPKLPIKPEQFLSDKERTTWTEEKNLQVFSFVHIRGYQLIDVLLDVPLDYKISAQKKETIRAKGVSVPLICRDDLIKLKNAAGRPQDLADIEALKQLT